MQFHSDYIIHCTMYSNHYIVYIIYTGRSNIKINCTLCTMYIIQCILYNVQCTMQCVYHIYIIIESSKWTVKFTLSMVHYTIYNVHYTVYSVHCTLFSAHSTLYNVIVYYIYGNTNVPYVLCIIIFIFYCVLQCTLYTICGTLSDVHYTQYNVNNI